MSSITTTEAANRLGLSTRRVQKFISEGRLPAKLFGNQWMIESADLEKLPERKKGRPAKKDKNEQQ